MDELRAALPPGFDPDAPLSRAPEPWAPAPAPSARPGPPWAMTEMIAAEPAVARRVAGRLLADGSATALAAAIGDAARRGEPVILTGCGTSEHAALAGAAILRDALRVAGHAGTGPVVAQAFELSIDPPRDGLVIGVSHEGGTAATVAALEASRAAGALTAVITASLGSPAAAAADIVLETVELDASWCHTVGYVSPIAALGVVGEAITGGGETRAVPQAVALADRVAARLAAGLAASLPAADGIAATFRDATTLLAVGSGADIPAARELALKVEEATWLPSAARDVETLLHGHLAATGPGTALVLVLADPVSRRVRVARAVQALRAAAAIGVRASGILAARVSDGIAPELTPAGRIVVPEEAELAGPAAALLGTAAPLQLLTERLARARGTNPDLIRRDDPRYLEASRAARSED